jgi:hypothetical protein
MSVSRLSGSYPTLPIYFVPRRGAAGSKPCSVPWRNVTLFDLSAMPFHGGLSGLALVSASGFALARPCAHASCTNPSTGSRRTTSETRWSRTSPVTRPIPAPTSSARVLLTESVGRERSGRRAEGTVQSSGRILMRKRREPRASSLGMGFCYKSALVLYEECEFTPEPKPPLRTSVSDGAHDEQNRTCTEHTVETGWLVVPVLDALHNVWFCHVTVKSTTVNNAPNV